MKVAQLVNLIIGKFPKAEFLEISSRSDSLMVKVGPRRYFVAATGFCMEMINNHQSQDTAASRWLTGVLVGKVRNEEGELV